MSKLIGRILATENSPTTIDKFTFWTDSKLILNPFDVVKIEHVNNSFSYGVIEDISHITDASSFLTNFISSDFGDVECEENTLRVGMNYIKASVICNNKNIYIPVQSNSKVYLANADEITYALGLKDIKNPLVCGYLDMYEGTQDVEPVRIPVNLNSKFIIGPEGAHLNISGISGLAAKTSYAMFLMKAIQDKYLENHDEDDNVAFVFFNVKGKDLLAIDQLNDFDEDGIENIAHSRTVITNEYKALGLSPEPFKQVTYFYPNSMPNSGQWNTYLTQDEVKDNLDKNCAYQFGYLYKEDKDNLDLLFSNIEDSTQTMDSIVSYIMSGQGNFNSISDWGDFLDEVKNKCTSTGSNNDKEIAIASWRKFYRIVNKAIYKNSIFARDLRESEKKTRLEDAIKKIKKNDIYVIDIAKLSEDKQSYVFGDTVRAISNLQLGEYSAEVDVNPPKKIVIFIDELNKYASKETPKSSPILRQILDVAERGRSLGIILFGAEQFRSAIHDRVTGNCSTHAYGRTNSIELSKGDYKSVPSVYKTIMTRLKQGEYIIQNPVFRSLLSVKFPRPIYRQFKGSK